MLFRSPDDFIFVRSGAARDVYVLGAVNAPNVIPYSQDLSLAAVIAKTGGLAQYAHSAQTSIVRGSIARPRLAVVDFKTIVKGKDTDIRLQPGDIVYVPYSPFKRIAQIADYALQEFTTTVAVNEGRNAVIRNGGPVGIAIGITGQ